MPIRFASQGHFLSILVFQVSISIDSFSFKFESVQIFAGTTYTFAEVPVLCLSTCTNAT